MLIFSLILLVIICAKLSFDKNSLNDELASLSDKNKRLEEKLDKSNSDLKDLKAKHDSLLAKKSKLEAKNKKLEEDLAFFTEIEQDSKKLSVVKDEEPLPEENFKEKSAQEDRPPETAPKKEESKTSIETIEEFDDAEDHGLEPQKDEDFNNTFEDYEPEEIEEPQITSNPLNQEKQIIFNQMEFTNNNLLITGRAGTGKSFLLKYFQQNTEKKVLFAAPTGIAALNIGATTIHSIFGFDNLKESDAPKKLSSNQSKLLRSIDTLIIDEISMVRVDTLNQIDKILKIANSSSQPFGGKQVILFGDLFQLPPVANFNERSFFTKKYGGIFFFNSPVYKEADFETYELQKIFRQKDGNFISILNNVRSGNASASDISQLNSRYNIEIPRRILRIVSRKDEASNINQDELGKIPANSRHYQAEITYGDKSKIKETDFTCTFDLELKPGAVIMMIANDPDKRWVNGTIGITKRLFENYIEVVIDGVTYKVERSTFSKNKAVYNQAKDRLEYTPEFEVKQFPVNLAYAITIHKSQGMTYQEIACDLSSCFAAGQAYVALSRCAKFEGLYLLKAASQSQIKTDYQIVDFYKRNFS